MIPALALVADLRTIELSDWSEVHLRGGTNQSVVMDLTTSPAGTLVWRGRTTHLTLTYQAFLSVTDIGITVPPPLLFHTVSLDTGWRGRFTQVGLTESFTEGLVNGVVLNSLGAQAPIGNMPQTVASQVSAATTVDFISSWTTLTLTTLASAHWQFEVHGSYIVSGGLTGDDQKIIPLQHGPSGGATAYYLVSRVDSAYAHVDGTRSETTYGPCVGAFGTPLAGATAPDGTTLVANCAPDSYIGRALLGERHELSPVSTFSLGGGVGLVEARLNPTDPYITTFYPVAAASYEYRLKEEGHRVDIRADAAVSPFVDLRSGAVDDRAQVSGNLSWIRGRITVSGTVGAAATLVTSQLPPTQLVFVTSRVDQHLDRHFTVTYGLSFFWEHQEGADDISSVIASLGFAAGTLPMRF